MTGLGLSLLISTPLMSARMIFCRRCGVGGAHRYGKDRQQRQRYKCPDCGTIFTRRTNTAKSGSRLSDREWELALRIFASRGGMSGADLGRVLGCGRRTGQRMNRAFRQATLFCVPRSLPGPTEWDESVVSKQWVVGGVSRTTRQCVLHTIKGRAAAILIPLVEMHTVGDDPIFTDEHWGYYGLLNHWTVCHAREFVRKEARFVHTNTQEGIWGHLKELSRHVYRGFPKATLHQFLAEFMFRYNHQSYETRLSVLSALLTRPKTNSLVV
jgi:transposase